MIVWGGGATGVGGVNDGGRRNPVTNTWTALVGMSSPRARSTHAATSTGAEMIVWGGLRISGIFESRGRATPLPPTLRRRLPTTGVRHWPARMHKRSGRGCDVVVFGGGELEREWPAPCGRRPVSAVDRRIAPDVVGRRRLPRASRLRWSRAGDRVVVWGGSGSQFLRWHRRRRPRYDPVKTTPGRRRRSRARPASRWNPAYVWTGSRMIVWGNTSTGGGR